MDINIFANSKVMTALLRVVIIAAGGAEIFNQDQITSIAGAGAVVVMAILTAVSHARSVPKKQAAKAVLRAAAADPKSTEAADIVKHAVAGKF